MADPLIGSIHNSTGILEVRDYPAAGAADPRVQVSLAGRSMEMSGADIVKALSVLKQAQELLSLRKEQEFLERNYKLF